MIEVVLTSGAANLELNHQLDELAVVLKIQLTLRFGFDILSSSDERTECEGLKIRQFQRNPVACFCKQTKKIADRKFLLKFSASIYQKNTQLDTILVCGHQASRLCSLTFQLNFFRFDSHRAVAVK